ncbi:MAG: SgcJ/EcaC family oxidoreductase [Imperialibacter sp.]
MKASLLLVLCVFALFQLAFGQVTQNDKAITKLIDQYSEARETKDTVLLKDILTDDIDQLVSNGEWRMGIRVAIDGMMRSSTANPGTRTLTVDKIRYLGDDSAIADCRYEIKNPDGSERKMWSTFVVVKQKGKWRISAIRNMLPAG